MRKERELNEKNLPPLPFLLDRACGQGGCEAGVLICTNITAINATDGTERAGKYTADIKNTWQREAEDMWNIRGDLDGGFEPDESRVAAGGIFCVNGCRTDPERKGASVGECKDFRGYAQG